MFIQTQKLSKLHEILKFNQVLTKKKITEETFSFTTKMPLILYEIRSSIH